MKSNLNRTRVLRAPDSNETTTRFLSLIVSSERTSARCLADTYSTTRPLACRFAAVAVGEKSRWPIVPGALLRRRSNAYFINANAITDVTKPAVLQLSFEILETVANKPRTDCMAAALGDRLTQY